MNKKWDEELKMRLKSAITDSCGTKEVVKTCLAYIENDRKHQLEELVKKMTLEKIIAGLPLKERCKYYLKLAKKIQDFVKDELGGENNDH